MTFAERRCGVTCGGSVEVENDDLCAVVSEGGGGSTANAPRGCCTRDDCNFALKKHERNL
jgi:hypothetical protein